MELHVEPRADPRRDPGLWVWATLRDSGALSFSRQSLGGGLGESEESHTVAAPDVPLVVAALGGAEGDDVLELLRSRAGAITALDGGRWTGSPVAGAGLQGQVESRWLDAHGIPHEWWGS